MTGVSFADDREPPTENIIVLLDGSESIVRQPSNQAVIAKQFIDLSRLTRGRLKLAFLKFGGAGVHVVAGDDGLPMAASDVLREGVDEMLAVPFGGGTPLEGCFEQLIPMLKELRDQPTTVVLISDGTPTGPLRPDQYPPVKEFIAQREAAALREGGQEAVEALHARLGDPESADSQAGFAIQYPLLLQRCMSLAQQIDALNVRFVSLAFSPDMVDLQQIHEAAGGSGDTYREVQVDSAMRTIHELDLVSGVISYPIIDLPASDEFATARAFQLSGELNAAGLVVVRLTATPQIQTLATVGVMVDGRGYTTGKKGTAPELSVAFDSEDRLSTLSLITGPANSGKFGYGGNDEIAFPGAEIYRYIEWPEGLRVLCHPDDVSPDEERPIRINHRSATDWLLGLQWDTGETIPLESAEAIFKNKETGREYLMPASADRRFENLFVASATEFAPGLYDVFLSLKLSSGLPFRTRIDKAFEVVTVPELVKLEISDDSKSFDSIDFDRLGDAEYQRTVRVTVHSSTEHDLNLEFRVVGLTDSEGTAIGEDWILAQEPVIQLPSGESAELVFICDVPVDTADSIVDGGVTGTLEVVNAETEQLVTVEPLIEGTGDAESLSTVRFELQRPRIEVSAPRAFHQWIESDDEGPRLRLFPNFFPCRRDVELRILTDSRIARELYVRLSGLRDDGGRPMEGVELLPDPNWTGSMTVEPGASRPFVMRLRVEDSDVATGSGKLIVAGKGLRPVVVSVRAGAGFNWGWWLRLLAILLAAIFAAWVVRCLITKLTIKRLCKSNSLQPFAANVPVFDLFTFQKADDRTAIVPLVDGLTLGSDPEDAEYLDHEAVIDVEQEQPKVYAPDGRVVAIDSLDGSGETMFIRLISGGEFDDRYTAAHRWQWVSGALFALTATFASAIDRLELVIRTAQWATDAIGLS